MLLEMKALTNKQETKTSKHTKKPPKELKKATNKKREKGTFRWQTGFVHYCSLGYTVKWPF